MDAATFVRQEWTSDVLFEVPRGEGSCVTHRFTTRETFQLPHQACRLDRGFHRVNPRQKIVPEIVFQAKNVIREAKRLRRADGNDLAATRATTRLAGDFPPLFPLERDRSLTLNSRNVLREGDNVPQPYWPTRNVHMHRKGTVDRGNANRVF